VADLKPLTKLTAMQSLYLTDNKVTDLTPIAGLTKLASLALGNNQVKDLKPLAKLTRIKTLELTGNQIVDVTPLNGLREVSILQLDKNKITDLAPLVKWAKADAEKDKLFAPYLRLYLADNPLSNDAKEKQLPELKKIGVKLEDLKEKKKDK